MPRSSGGRQPYSHPVFPSLSQDTDSQFLPFSLLGLPTMDIYSFVPFNQNYGRKVLWVALSATFTTHFISLTLCSFTRDTASEEPHSPNTGLVGGWRQAEQGVMREGRWADPGRAPAPPLLRYQSLDQMCHLFVSLFHCKNESNNIWLMEL